MEGIGGRGEGKKGRREGRKEGGRGKSSGLTLALGPGGPPAGGNYAPPQENLTPPPELLSTTIFLGIHFLLSTFLAPWNDFSAPFHFLSIDRLQVGLFIAPISFVRQPSLG